MSERREQIVAAARAILDAEGAAAISVRSVAARAGIGASTLRHYFPTQSELLDAVFAGAFDMALDDLRIADTTISPRERLAECLAQFFPLDDALEQSLAQWFELVTAVVDSSASPERRAAWTAFIRQAHVRVARWLALLHEEGALRPGSPERHARLLLAVVDGLAMRVLLPGYSSTPVELRETMDDVIAAVLIDTRHSP